MVHRWDMVSSTHSVYIPLNLFGLCTSRTTDLGDWRAKPRVNPPLRLPSQTRRFPRQTSTYHWCVVSVVRDVILHVWNIYNMRSSLSTYFILLFQLNSFLLVVPKPFWLFVLVTLFWLLPLYIHVCTPDLSVGYTSVCDVLFPIKLLIYVPGPVEG